MNRILKMAIKDLRLLSRDRMGAFFIIGFPILMGLFFGLIMGGSNSSEGRAKMQVAIVDDDDSDMSRKFIESLKANDSIEISMDQQEPARESVRKGQRVAMMVLEKGFGERAGVLWGDPPTIKLGVDPSRSAEAGMLQGFVMESIGQLVGDRFQDPELMKNFIDQSRQELAQNKSISATNRMLLQAFFGSLENMTENIGALQNQSDGSSEAPNGGQGVQFANIETLDVSRTIDPESTAGQIAKLKSPWDISFPQAMMWGVLGCVAGFAISIAKERSEGTITRLRVAPVSKFEIICGKALACFITVILVIVMLTTLGVMLGMQPVSYPLLILAVLSISICFVGIMMFLSVIGKTEQAVGGSGWAINMIMAMLGGGMIPVMFMPSFMKSLSHLSPVKWGILSLEGAIWREFSFAEMLLPCAILISVGIVGMCIGTLIFSRTEA
jgi:ABC-2 type transport system permease protein